MADLFQLESSALPDGARVAAFRGHETISDLYRFEIGVLVQDGTELELETCVGASATLRADLGDGREHVVAGIFARFDLVHAWEGQALYRAVLVPRLWRATLSRHSRVFCDLTPIEALVTVLELIGEVDYEFRLQGDYEKRLLICQYKESDYAFLCRWMEREGIHFFFEHEGGTDTLIIADGPQHASLRADTVRYEPSVGDDASAGDCFDSLVCMQNALPSTVETRDFDYLRPNLDVRGGAPTQPAVGGELDLYGDNVLSPDEAGRYAKLRAEEQLAEARLVAATGRAFQLQAGATFALEGHPHGSLNHDYLVLRIEHEGVSAADDHVLRLLGIREPLEYRVKLQAIDATVHYRPPCRTPWPRIYGMERAFVDGPEESLYPHLDEHGRYKVKFAFDETRDGKDYDGSGSAWVRMMQPYGGSVEGFHFPINRGTEVLLTFLGGDPDRPVIAGVVPNQLTPSPVNKDNREMNLIATSYANLISICDLEHRQHIELWTPPETTYLYLGHPEHGKRSAYIEMNTGGNQLVNIGGQRDIVVGANQTVEIAGTFDTETGGTITVEGGGEYHVEISGAITFENGGPFQVESSGDQTFETPCDWHAETGGDITHEAGGSIHGEASGAITFESAVFDVETVDMSHEAANWKADIGSIDWKVGSAKISVPKWDCTNPAQTWKSASFSLLGSDYEWTAAKKVELVGLARGATGMKIETAGLAVSVNNFKAETQGVNLMKDGAFVGTDGIKSQMASMHMFT